MYILEVAMSFQWVSLPSHPSSILSVPVWNRLRKREKLSQYNTPRDAKTLIKNAKKILVLTGAGISTSHLDRLANSV